MSCRRKSKYVSSASRKAVSSERDGLGSESRQGEGQQEPPGFRGHGDECGTPRHFAKTSSSEWNSSDDLALSDPEDGESGVAPDSQCAHVALPYPPPVNQPTPDPSCIQRQPGTIQPGHVRPNQLVSPPQQGESGHALFRPRMLQEAFPPSPRLPSRSYVSPHRKPDISALRTFSDASSKSGSDPERSTPSSCESEERLAGCRAAEQQQQQQAVVAAAQQQEVSLTTYFNVDNCMTETYRLKYHNQRPLVLSAAMPRAAVVAAAVDCRDARHATLADAYAQDVPKARAETSKPFPPCTTRSHAQPQSCTLGSTPLAAPSENLLA